MSTHKKIKITFISIVFLWATGFTLFSIQSLSRAPQELQQTTDAIIVLTGGKNRVEEGLKLFAEGKALHLFITGVHKDVTKAQIKALWTGDHALPPCCISLGYQASTTKENADETREWLKSQPYHSLRLVTGNYHMNRALLEFKNALPDMEFYAHPVALPKNSPEKRNLLQLLFGEYHKTIFRQISMLFSPAKPAPER